jgi:hypothetical protein
MGPEASVSRAPPPDKTVPCYTHVNAIFFATVADQSWSIAWSPRKLLALQTLIIRAYTQGSSHYVFEHAMLPVSARTAVCYASSRLVPRTLTRSVGPRLRPSGPNRGRAVRNAARCGSGLEGRRRHRQAAPGRRARGHGQYRRVPAACHGRLRKGGPRIKRRQSAEPRRLSPARTQCLTRGRVGANRRGTAATSEGSPALALFACLRRSNDREQLPVIAAYRLNS